MQTVAGGQGAFTRWCLGITTLMEKALKPSEHSEIPAKLPALPTAHHHQQNHCGRGRSHAQRGPHLETDLLIQPLCKRSLNAFDTLDSMPGIRTQKDPPLPSRSSQCSVSSCLSSLAPGALNVAGGGTLPKPPQALSGAHEKLSRHLSQERTSITGARI